MRRTVRWLLWQCILVAIAMPTIGAARAQDEAALTAQIGDVASKLEVALRGVTDSPVDLKRVRIRYLLSRTMTNAFVTRESEPSEQDLREADLVVCLPIHPLAGEEDFAKQGGEPLDFSVLVGKPIVEKACESDPTRLACIIGHELGHLCLGHHSRGSTRGGKLELAQLSQQDEFDADAAGIRYALMAGFPDPAGAAVLLWQRMSARFGEQASLEPMSAFLSHPSSMERIAELQTDPVKRQLWRSLVSFDDGVTYLSLGDWLSAEGCFGHTLARFGESSEVHTNVGYARMMRFYSGLTEDAYRSLGGELSCMSYVTTRPPIRGGALVDLALLQSATDAFRRALVLNEHFYPARADLGTALTLAATLTTDPDARAKQLDEAVTELQAAAEDAATAGDTRVETDARANLALALTRKTPEKSAEIYRQLPVAIPPMNELLPLKYNLGVVLAGSEVEEDLNLADRLLSGYLADVAPGGYYAREATRNWVAVRDKLGLSTQPVPAPKRPKWLGTKSVTLRNGRRLYLHQDLAQIPAALVDLKPTVTGDVALGESGVWDAPEAGVTLRGYRGRLRMIVLSSPSAPPVEVKSRLDRTGVGPKLVLQVGETLKMLDDKGEHEAERRELGIIADPLDIGGRSFRLYSETGLAVAWAADGLHIAAVALVSG